MQQDRVSWAHSRVSMARCSIATLSPAPHAFSVPTPLPHPICDVPVSMNEVEAHEGRLEPGDGEDRQLAPLVRHSDQRDEWSHCAKRDDAELCLEPV